jgi:hypothetical protein
MTSSGCADGPCGSRVGGVVAPYREIFSVPGAWRFSAAGIIGRIPMAMIGLATVMLISGLTGRYGTGGAVSAVGALGYALVSPSAGRLADRFGQRRVLLPLAVLFAVSWRRYRGDQCAALGVDLIHAGPVGRAMPYRLSQWCARWACADRHPGLHGVSFSRSPRVLLARPRHGNGARHRLRPVTSPPVQCCASRAAWFAAQRSAGARRRAGCRVGRLMKPDSSS